MSGRIDRASDVEFAKAIAESLPKPDLDSKAAIVAKMGLAYLAGKAIGHAVKKKR